MELVRPRVDELTADEEAVALLELHDVARLGRGGVLEGGGDRRAVLAFVEVGHVELAVHRSLPACRDLLPEPVGRGQGVA